MARLGNGLLNNLDDLRNFMEKYFCSKIYQGGIEMETWKNVVGYEGLYEVSDQGRVKSLGNDKFRKEKILKPGNNTRGYLQVTLYKDGQKKIYKVHRLVAEAFIPNPNNLETVNHKDEVKTNNVATNLEWLSMKDNNNYGTHNKRVAESHINHSALSKQVKMLDKQTGELLATFPSMGEAERVTGIYQGNISKCCIGKYKSTGGYIWRYL